MAASSACTDAPKHDKHGHPHVSFSKAVDYMLKKHSCLSEITSEKEIKLPPRYIGRMDEGIRETLDADILKYSDDLNGVIFAYNKVKCLEMTGCINDEMPLIFFKVTVKYIVFKPQIGKKLKGVVNKIGHGHIGCLVHDCFNASIRKPYMVNNATKHGSKFLNNINIGSECIFNITGFDVHNDILSIKGDFDEESDVGKRSNGPEEKVQIKMEKEEYLSDDLPESQKAKKTKKSNTKNKPKNFEKADNLPNEEVREKSSKESNKKRTQSEMNSFVKNETKFVGNESINDSYTVPKKKKKKNMK